ncbi:type I pullulanase [Lachnoanaerobaculum gingivalis]|uniref:Type I pullulanase n=1 Tax=Lachnoanaerobaculum gingivalis TaxID=2490855 RepID=A0A3P3QZ60_9FIRM|nr:type I pullulanase [Lachnoanaerobaculum gingivalis]RRJ26048.1 type I pullulanase [Lachnoanaerobaculum gingivalis]WHE88620.1 type I pullulanase [Lachnoanaerobaculum gingivalis]
MENIIELKKYYSSKEFLENYIYEGNDLGVECNENGTTFKLWSPGAESVVLNLYEAGDGCKAYEQIPMEKADKGVWCFHSYKDLHKVYYDYLIKRDSKEVLTADPYAKAAGVNGIRSMAVNLKKTDPKGWENDKAPQKDKERVVYELHVKEFSFSVSGGFPPEYRQKYKAFTCKHTTLNNDGIHPTGLDYLKELGVTHIQIMPMYDYGSVDETKDYEFNWGYDPVNYNVPEGSYATDAFHGEVRITEMKEMIQSIHEAGFGVIMDVVYNHTYSLDSWFQRTLPWYFYRVFSDGKVSDGSACGNDVASERVMCSKYILESVLYWAREYHIDGFRFDLMGLLDTDLMNNIRKELDIIYGKGEKIIYGEPWSATDTAIEYNKKLANKDNIALLDENIGVFCDNTRDAIKGSALRIREAGFINGGKDKEDYILASVSAWCDPKYNKEFKGVKAPSQIVTYVSAHDNQTLWDKLDYTTTEEEAMRLNKLAAAIYMTCQGTLFFLSGEEFGRTKAGHDNTYNMPISVNRLNWKLAWKNKELVDYYKGLIALRKQISGLCDKSENSYKHITDMWKESRVVGFTVNNDKNSLWSQVKVIYNASKKDIEAKLLGGDFELLCDGNDSMLWKKNISVKAPIKVGKQSVLILGKKRIEEI